MARQTLRITVSAVLTVALAALMTVGIAPAAGASGEPGAVDAAPAATVAGGEMPVWYFPFAEGARWKVGSPHGSGGATAPRGALDFGPAPGESAEVLSIAAGTVVKIECRSTNKYYLGIDHGGGWTSTYYHLTDPQTELIGQHVPVGTYLGMAGRTLPCGGGATFDHVHVKIMKDGAEVSVDGFWFGDYQVFEGNRDYAGYWQDRSGARVLTNHGLAVCCLVATVPTAAFLDPGCADLVDVASTNVHCGAIEWLVAQGITRRGDARYLPAKDVNRGAMTAFLYRLTHPGEAAPTCADAPFDDVAPDALFCGSIAWAAQNGLARGYADGTFGAQRPVTRSAMVTLLKRLIAPEESVECEDSAPFADVSVDDAMCAAIAWAKLAGVTTGVGDDRFDGQAPVTRQSMATFLQRAAGLTG